MKYITTLIIFLFISIITIAQKPVITGQGSDKKVQDSAEIHITPGSSGVKRSIGYKFSSGIANGNPGTGIFRFDKDNISLVSNLIVSNIDIKGEDQTNWYSTWENSTGASGRGGVTIADSKGKVAGIFNFTGVFIKGNGFWKLPVEYISGSMPLNGSDYYYVFERITHKKPKPTEPEPVIEPIVVVQPEPIVEPPVVVQPEPIIVPPVVVQPAPVVEPPVVVQPAPVVEPPVVVQPAPVVEPPVVVQPSPVTEVNQPNQRTQRIVKTEVTEPSQITKRPPRQSVPVTQTTQRAQPTQSTQSTQVSQRPQPTQQTQPIQPPQPAQQTQPKQPSQPTYPVQPAQQPQPKQQTQPTYPTQPIQQTQPTYPTYPNQQPQQNQPTYTTRPTQQTQPTYPTRPTQQTQATYPTQPTQQTQPVQTQVQSNQGREETQMYSPYQVTQDNQNPYAQSRERLVSGSRSKWYRGIIEAGYAFGLGDYGINNFRFNFINGVHLGKFSSLGLGIGYRKLFTSNNSAPYLASNMSQIPVFLDFRTNFSTRPVTPYLAVGLGTLLESGTSETSKGRYLFNTSGGIWFNLSERFAVFAGIDFEMMNLEFSDTDPFTNNYNKNSNSIGLNIGISF